MQPAEPLTPSLIQEQRSLIKDLHREVHALKRELAILRSDIRQQPTLGFSDGRDYIIIEREKSILWHRFEGDESVPIRSKVLKGYIRRVAYVDKEYPKLHVFIDGDREYVLVSGFETHFSRELMAAIASMRPEDFAYPVIIKPDTGSEEGESKSKHKPVFCNLICQGKLVKPGALRNRDAQELFRLAEAVLKGESPTQSPKLPSRTQQAETSVPSASTVDWVGVCQDLKISSQQLKQVAKSLNLPYGKLTRSQASQLYQAVYQQYRTQLGKQSNICSA